MEKTDELLTATDVAGLFKISPETVYSWRYQGKIPYIKINGAVRFRRSDMQRMIDTNTHQRSASQVFDSKESNAVEETPFKR
jgi:predicted site-specific integrase-resolvase